MTRKLLLMFACLCIGLWGQVSHDAHTIWNRTISSTAPQTGQYFCWNGTLSKYSLCPPPSSQNLATSTQAATAAVLPNTPTYSNGTAGVGATLTSATNTALVVDGYTVLLNDRVLVNNQAAGAQNGVYKQTTLGDGSHAWVLTRATDFNTATSINNAGVIPVINGNTNAGTYWSLSATITTIGTDTILYTQAPTPNPPNHVINFSLTPTATGDQGIYPVMPFACANIVGWYITSNSGTSGSIQISLYKTNGAIPTTGNTKISASAPIILSSATWNSTLSPGTGSISTWSPLNFVPGDTLLFNVDSYSTLTGVTGAIWCQ